MTSVETLHLSAHDRSYRMEFNVPDGYDRAPGRTAACIRDNRPYERSLLEHIYDQRFTGTAIDVGANCGNHTLWLAVVCGLDVVAFEPLYADRLKTNIRINNLGGRVRVEPVALGDARGKALRAGRGRLVGGGSRLSRLRRQLLGTARSVPVRTLDSFDRTNVSVMKIDVEGMEPAVLRGGMRTIRRDQPVIFCEEWGPSERDAIAAVLEPWGYSAGQVFHGSPNAAAVRCWKPAGH